AAAITTATAAISGVTARVTVAAITAAAVRPSGALFLRMIPTRGTAVLITQGGQQLSLFFAIDLRAVQNL
ncbi:hypothetical protein, partial [Mycobacterium avium]|uniref:hypothetical protein n=1 Tax=Mycobacterium avium TaxID=1764 RepID=UPI0015944F54